MRNLVSLSLSAAALAFLATSLTGQEVRAKVVSAESGEPVVLPTVTVGADSSFLGGPDGTFRLAGLPAGQTRLRVEQIGFAALDTLVLVQPGAPLELVLRLVPRPIPLERLVVTGGPEVCTRPGFDAAADTPELAALLDEFRKNAERYRLLRAAFPSEGRYTVTRKALGRGEAVLSETTRVDTLRSDAAEPYRVGRVLQLPDPAQGRTRPHFAMPGAQDLAGDEFQGSHCFRYAGTERVGEWRMHRIDFVPAANVATADVKGSIYLDVEHLLLRRSTFEMVNLPERSVSVASLATTVNYREVAGSLMVPAEYWATQRVRGLREAGQPVAALVDHGKLEHLRFLRDTPGQGPAGAGR